MNDVGGAIKIPIRSPVERITLKGVLQTHNSTNTVIALKQMGNECTHK